MHELTSGLVVVQEAMTEFGCDQAISIGFQKAELKQLAGAEGQVSIFCVRVEAIVVGRLKEQQELLLEKDDDVLTIHD